MNLPFTFKIQNPKLKIWVLGFGFKAASCNHGTKSNQKVSTADSARGDTITPKINFYTGKITSNPKDADAGTIRKDFAESIEANSVHGSDSTLNAKIEIDYFFAGYEIIE